MPVTPPARVNGIRRPVRWSLTPSDVVADVSSPVRGRETWYDTPPAMPRRLRSITPGSVSSFSTLPTISEMGKEAVELVRICILGTGPLEILNLMDRIRPLIGLVLVEKIRKVKSIRQPDSETRTDLWVTADAAPLVLRKLRVTKRWKWRVVHWRSWVDRIQERRDKVSAPPLSPPRRIRIATYNVNGWRGKKDQVIHFLHREGIAIALLQETLVYKTDKPVSVTGYDIYPIDAERGTAGRRGQVICVHKALKAISLNLNDSNIVGVRTAKMPGSEGIWYILGLYLPSGGNHRLERGQILGRLRRLLRRLMRKDREARIIVGGDWNIERERLKTIVERWKVPVRLHPIGGSPKTRRTRKVDSSWSCIDGFVTSEGVERLLNVSRVNRTWDLSDHYPVICSLKGLVAVPLAKERLLFDRRKIANVALKVASDNRWQMLETLGEDMDTDIDRFEAEFTKTCQEVASDNNLIVSSTGGRKAHCLDRGTKRMIDKRRILNQQLVRADDDDIQRALTSEVNNLNTAIDVKIKKSRSKYRMTLIKHGVDLWVTGQTAAWWKWLDGLVHYKVDDGVGGSYPINDDQNVLQLTDKGIAEVLRKHYEKLGEDLSEKSLDKEFWKEKWSKEPHQDPNPEMFGRPVTWLEIHERLGKTAYGKAVGKDGVPYEFLRVARTGYDKNNPKPPNPMARVILKYVQLCFGRGRLPKEDLKSNVISIFKSGETSKPSNYRGIFLINHKAKLVNGIETERLTKQLELTSHLYTEQGGFRRGEAVMENVCTLYEIVRRRTSNNLPTYIFFGDLVKAFDKVPFGALLASMEAAGATHPVTSLAWDSYTNSEQSCIAGDAISAPYKVYVGTKQGDVPSPPNFDVFINPLIKRLRSAEGVPVAGLHTNKRIHSLVFADDLLVMADSIVELQNVVKISEEWAREMYMAWGIPKCGVMILGATPEQREE